MSGRSRGWLLLLASLALAVLAGGAPGSAQTPPETAAMITEIKVGRGKVEMKTADGDWHRAMPLSALRAGDQVRAVGDASVVVLLTGGRGTVLVKAKGSPYTVGAPRADESTAQRARTLLEISLGFLASGAKEPPKAVTSSRSGNRPPEVLTPRNGLILPDSLVFEWLGNRFSRYRVRVTEGSSVVLERKGVVGARLTYPADAPPLKPGVRYQLQVEASGAKPAEAWFEIVDETRAAEVRDNLKQLEASLGRRVSPSSLAVVRGGALAADELYHDARLVVLTALAKDPDEPSLHLLLGNIYEKTGLPRLAAQSLDEAHFLLSHEKK
jgi:hypothetical protein